MNLITALLFLIAPHYSFSCQHPEPELDLSLIFSNTANLFENGIFPPTQYPADSFQNMELHFSLEKLQELYAIIHSEEIPYDFSPSANAASSVPKEKEEKKNYDADSERSEEQDTKLNEKKKTKKSNSNLIIKFIRETVKAAPRTKKKLFHCYEKNCRCPQQKHVGHTSSKSLHTHLNTYARNESLQRSLPLDKKWICPRYFCPEKFVYQSLVVAHMKKNHPKYLKAILRS